MSRLIDRGITALVRGWRGLRSRLQRWCWNRQPGVRVAASARIAPSARLVLDHGGAVWIGARVELSDGVIVAPYGGSIRVEDDVYVGPYSVLYGHGGLTIGRDTLIAAHSVFIPANHIFTDRGRPVRRQSVSRRGISIGRDVWLGCGVRVLDGARISDGCVVGAGSVVTENLDPYVVAVGTPARPIRER